MLFFILNSTVVDAGKIFKWTDDEGNVHFGQRPPSGNKKAVKVRGAQSSVVSSERSDGFYCGDIKLQSKPRYSSNPRYQQKKYRPSAQELDNKIRSWRKSLRRSQDSLSQYLRRISKINPNRSSYYSRSQSAGFYERKENLTKSIAEYTCAIDWAEEKALSLRVGSASEIDEHKRAEEDLRAAKKQQRDFCGREPTGYNKYGSDRDAYRDWERCQRKYGAVVRKMERNVHQAQSALNKVN